MRVFVYEHLCTLPGVTSSLRAEGRAMLSAALADMAACDGVEAVTLVEPSLVEAIRAISPRIVVLEVSSLGTEQMFRRLARDSSFALVIAPEFDDILATRCEWVVEEGCRLLGPSPEAVRLCADKLRLAEHWGGLRFPMPRTTLYDHSHPPEEGYPYVVKPRCGAGAQATFLVRSAEEYARVIQMARAQGNEGELIVQPFIRGVPGSVAVICGSCGSFYLPPVRQHLETTFTTGQIRYAGGSVEYPPGVEHTDDSAFRVRMSLPGLAGYLGIDLVYNGFKGVVIEINPRLTTSYIGLRRLSKVNLMQVLLDVVQGKEPSPLSWREGRVLFAHDGTVYED